MPVTEIDPTTALVLIDFQRGILALASQELVRPTAIVASRLAAGLRARGLPVILVRTAFSPDGRDAPRNRVSTVPAIGALPERYVDILDEIAPEPTDLVVTKRQPGAFHGTDLDLQLRRRGVTGIVIGGLFTSFGVESTGRAAYDHGFNVTFASDAMADLDPVAHAHSIEATLPRFGEVGDAASILTIIAAAPSA
jgi:nicotinamidase-related amidase